MHNAPVFVLARGEQRTKPSQQLQSGGAHVFCDVIAVGCGPSNPSLSHGHTVDGRDSGFRGREMRGIFNIAQEEEEEEEECLFCKIIHSNDK